MEPLHSRSHRNTNHGIEYIQYQSQPQLQPVHCHHDVHCVIILGETKYIMMHTTPHTTTPRGACLCWDTCLLMPPRPPRPARQGSWWWLHACVITCGQHSQHANSKNVIHVKCASPNLISRWTQATHAGTSLSIYVTYSYILVTAEHACQNPNQENKGHVDLIHKRLSTLSESV